MLEGLADELSSAYDSLPRAAVEKALLDGLEAAAEDESMELSDLVCTRDYSVACPEGEGQQALVPGAAKDVLHFLQGGWRSQTAEAVRCVGRVDVIDRQTKV